MHVFGAWNWWWREDRGTHFKSADTRWCSWASSVKEMGRVSLFTVKSRGRGAAVNEKKYLWGNITSEVIKWKRHVALSAFTGSVSQCFPLLDAGGVRHMERVVISLFGSRCQRPPVIPAAFTKLIKHQTTHTCVSAQHWWRPQDDEIRQSVA